MTSTFEFFYCAPENSNVDGILLGDKNATSLSFKIISTLIESFSKNPDQDV